MPMIQVDQQTAENRKILYLLQRYCSEEAVFADCINGDKLRKPFQDVVTALQAEIEKDELDTETVFMIESRMMQFINRLHHPDANGYHDYDAEAAVAYLDKYYSITGKHKAIIDNKKKVMKKNERKQRPLRIISIVAAGICFLLAVPSFILHNMQPETGDIQLNIFGHVGNWVKYDVLHRSRPVVDESIYSKLSRGFGVAALVFILISICAAITLLVYKLVTLPKLTTEEIRSTDNMEELSTIRTAFENVSKMINELEEY